MGRVVGAVPAGGRTMSLHDTIGNAWNPRTGERAPFVHRGGVFLVRGERFTPAEFCRVWLILREWDMETTRDVAEGGE